jgi:hypothetical protein
MFCSVAVSTLSSPGRDKGGYYHELFLRSKSFLAYRIPRTKLKNEGARKSTSPETEPNFYVLPYLPEEAPRTTNRLQGLFSPSSAGVADETKTSQVMDSVPSLAYFGVNHFDRLAGASDPSLRQPLLIQDQLSSLQGYFPSQVGMTDQSLLLSQLAYQQALANSSPYPHSTFSGPSQQLALQLEVARGLVPRPDLSQLISNNDMHALRLALARNYSTSVDQLLRNSVAPGPGNHHPGN